MNDIFISKGNLAGRGVYANRDFRAGEIVIKYHLKPISEQEYQKLPEGDKMFTHVINGQIYLYSEPERYVNHSDTPNTYQDHGQMADVALRDIAKDEMITCDDKKDDTDQPAQ